MPRNVFGGAWKQVRDGGSANRTLIMTMDCTQHVAMTLHVMTVTHSGQFLQLFFRIAKTAMHFCP